MTKKSEKFLKKDLKACFKSLPECKVYYKNAPTKMCRRYLKLAYGTFQRMTTKEGMVELSRYLAGDDVGPFGYLDEAFEEIQKIDSELGLEECEYMLQSCVGDKSEKDWQKRVDELKEKQKNA